MRISLNKIWKGVIEYIIFMVKSFFYGGIEKIFYINENLYITIKYLKRFTVQNGQEAYLN